MKIVKLPSVLPGELDLSVVNEELQQGIAQLDWSAVESVSDKYLTVLLAGLDLSNDAEVLGIEGDIADNIAGDIVRFFTQQANNKKVKKAKKVKNTQDPEVQIWSVSSQDDQDIEQTNTIKQDNILLSTNNTNNTNNIEEKGKDESDISIIEATLKLPIAQINNTLPTETTNILTIPSAYEIRAELEKIVLDDLLGPAGGENEEITELRVSDRYLVGVLAPLHRKQYLEQEDDEDLAVAGKDSSEEGQSDTSIAAARTMMPSSFGMTFCASGEAKAIRLYAKWGKYDRVKSEHILTDKGNPETVWQRQQVKGNSPVILLKEGAIDKWIVDRNSPDVYVQGLIRKQDNEWIISVFLINGQTEPKQNVDKAWIFQPELVVKSADKNFVDIFVRRPKYLSSLKKDSAIYLEEQTMDMLYRREIEFAIGHGVSVHAEVAADNKEKAIAISTRVVPAYEVAKVTPPTAEEIPGLGNLVLDMKELAECSAKELKPKLIALTTTYQNWIFEQENRLKDPSENLADFQSVAELAISNCKTTLERIKEGLDLLEKDSKALEAFQFMNRAMWQQRIHSIFAEKKRRDEKVELSVVDIAKNRTWFPFQLAFILLNLPSITDLSHEDRCHETDAIADLLWFPTGGGKTEAYLGLTAYTLGLRRLQGTIAGRSGEYGVAVLMRYTLRLLTLQQFQRATALICACEFIRREAIKNGNTKWGKEPFRIGLWVGKRTTPNTTQQSEEYTKQARGAYNGASGSPHQLTNCPWCGNKIEEGKNIVVQSFAKGQARTIVYCGDPLGRCLFSATHSPNEGLPVIVVDEEVYRRLPSLLISTVDKFAQMPWNGATQMLFGQVEAYCDRHGFKSPEIDDSSHPRKDSLPATKLIPHNPLRPPDLIIQDELHLISGPLGTLVGLYETAVDKLASWEINGKVVRPKVIASTATIRQAKEQVHNLFLRKVQVFPPQCLDASDNFFARQRMPNEETPGRRYLGICAPGRRLTAALIRVYVAQLAAAQTLYLKYGVAVDPWMTLVGYFNSLRELAGMRRQVDDSIRSRLNKMDRRGLSKRSKLYFEELIEAKKKNVCLNK